MRHSEGGGEGGGKRRAWPLHVWMLRAWALLWSPTLLVLFIAVRLSAVDTKQLGLPVCVPFLLLIVAAFLTTLRDGPFRPKLYPLLAVPFNDVLTCFMEWDDSLSAAAALSVHSFNAFVLLAGLVGLHGGWLLDVWPAIRGYLLLVGAELVLVDLYLFQVAGAERYPAPGGTDTLRASLFTAAAALVAAVVSEPRMRQLFLLEWTAVPLSSIPFEDLTGDGTLPEAVVRNLTDLKLGPGIVTIAQLAALAGDAEVPGAVRGGARAKLVGAGCNAGAIGGGGGGGAGGAGTMGSARSRTGASSMCSDETNSEIACEIAHMTRGLTAQGNAGVHCVGYARESGRDPEWDGPGFLTVGSSRTSSRASTIASRSRSRGVCDS